MADSTLLLETFFSGRLGRYRVTVYRQDHNPIREGIFSIFPVQWSYVDFEGADAAALAAGYVGVERPEIKSLEAEFSSTGSASQGVPDKAKDPLVGMCPWMVDLEFDRVPAAMQPLNVLRIQSVEHDGGGEFNLTVRIGTVTRPRKMGKALRVRSTIPYTTGDFGTLGVTNFKFSGADITLKSALSLFQIAAPLPLRIALDAAPMRSGVPAYGSNAILIPSAIRNGTGAGELKDRLKTVVRDFGMRVCQAVSGPYGGEIVAVHAARIGGAISALGDPDPLAPGGGVGERRNAASGVGAMQPQPVPFAIPAHEVYLDADDVKLRGAEIDEQPGFKRVQLHYDKGKELVKDGQFDESDESNGLPVAWLADENDNGYNARITRNGLLSLPTGSSVGPWVVQALKMVPGDYGVRFYFRVKDVDHPYHFSLYLLGLSGNSYVLQQTDSAPSGSSIFGFVDIGNNVDPFEIQPDKNIYYRNQQSSVKYATSRNTPEPGMLVLSIVGHSNGDLDGALMEKASIVLVDDVGRHIENWDVGIDFESDQFGVVQVDLPDEYYARLGDGAIAGNRDRPAIQFTSAFYVDDAGDPFVAASLAHYVAADTVARTSSGSGDFGGRVVAHCKVRRLVCPAARYYFDANEDGETEVLGASRAKINLKTAVSDTHFIEITTA